MMGYLANLQLSAANTTRLTLSTWFRIPQDQYDSYSSAVISGPFVARQFGSFGIYTANTSTEVRLTGLNVGGSLRWLFIFATGDGGFNYPLSSCDHQILLPETWYHLFVAVKTEGDEYAQRCYFYLNREIINDATPAAGQVIQPLPNIGVWSQWDTFEGFFGFGSNYDQAIIDEMNPHLPAFSMDVSNGEIDVPNTVVGGSFPVNGKMDVGDFQLWVGTFIDPTNSANLDKFVVVANGIGRKVAPSVAAEAFGEQTILCSGGASSFPTNRGTGGAFTTIGTLTDFVPAASFEVIE